jgi:hypothetical protein
MRKRIVSLVRDPRVQGAGDALLAFLLAVTSVGSIFLSGA